MRIKEDYYLPYRYIAIRQALRLLFLPFLFLYVTSDKEVLLTIFGLNALLIIAIDTSRYEVPTVRETVERVFGKIMFPYEKDPSHYHLTGASYLSIGMAVGLVLLPKSIFLTAFLTFIIADICATFVSEKLGSQPFFDKKLEGIIIYILISTFFMITVGIWTQAFWPHYLAGALSIIVISVIYGASSFLPLNINLLIPIGLALCMWVLQMLATPL